MNENIINNKKEIVFLGDSITAWNPELKKIENSKNLGIPGFASRDIVWQLQGDDEEIISGNTAVFMAGVNDIMMGYSVDRVISNITEIAEMLTKRFERIIIVSILPIDNFSMCEEIRAVNNKIKNLPDTEYLDIHNLFLNERKTIDFKWTTDGAHLNSYGYEIFNKHLFEILNLK